jgi:ABC-type transport system involved in multi-copper enzyme maturation permease subunit
MLDTVLALAGMVFKENFRKRVIHVFLAIAVLILIWAGTFSVFSLGVQVKFLKDISLSAIRIMGVLITLTVTAGQLSNEYQYRTIYPLLAKPVSRFHILLGKFLGAIYVIILNIGILAIIFLGLLYYRQHFLDIITTQAIYLIALECGVLAAMCLCFSTFFSTAANVCASFLIYLIGQLKFSYGNYIAQRMDYPGVGLVVSLLQNPLLPPNMEYFNIGDAIVSGVPVHLSYMVNMTLYGIGMMVFYLILANLLFLRRDL